MKVRLPLIVTAVCWLAYCVPASAADSDCGARLQQALESDLALSYTQFDQTQGQGFRRLSEKGCHKEAADLIEAYIRANEAAESSLVWHVAQLRAMHGDYGSAIGHARKSLRANEDLSKNALRWNDYVLAVVAFLQGDKEKLAYHRERVSLGVGDHYGNRLNLNVLDKLLANFGQPYASAVAD